MKNFTSKIIFFRLRVNISNLIVEFSPSRKKSSALPRIYSVASLVNFPGQAFLKRVRSQTVHFLTLVWTLLESFTQINWCSGLENRALAGFGETVLVTVYSCYNNYYNQSHGIRAFPIKWLHGMKKRLEKWSIKLEFEMTLFCFPNQLFVTIKMSKVDLIVPRCFLLHKIIVQRIWR